MSSVLEGTDVVFPTKLMNEHLICSLCMGYLRDAQTITECLHTFCKNCIHLHFREYSSCPSCEISLGPAPFEKIRSDRAMQNIVDKVFPHFSKEEAAAEKHYQDGAKRKPEEASAESDAKRKKLQAAVAAKRSKAEKQVAQAGATKKICLSLFPCEVTDGETLPKLHKPFLRYPLSPDMRNLTLDWLASKISRNVNHKPTNFTAQFLNPTTSEYPKPELGQVVNGGNSKAIQDLPCQQAVGGPRPAGFHQPGGAAVQGAGAQGRVNHGVSLEGTLERLL